MKNICTLRISRVSDVGSGQRSQTESTRKEPCPASRAWREKALPRKLFRVDRNGLRGAPKKSQAKKSQGTEGDPQKQHPLRNIKKEPKRKMAIFSSNASERHQYRVKLC